MDANTRKIIAAILIVAGIAFVITKIIPGWAIVAFIAFAAAVVWNPLGKGRDDSEPMA